MSESAEEFDCAECRRHIVRIIPQPTMPKLCAECIHMPGWFSDPELARMLDPEYRASQQ